MRSAAPVEQRHAQVVAEGHDGVHRPLDQLRHARLGLRQLGAVAQLQLSRSASRSSSSCRLICACFAYTSTKTLTFERRMSGWNGLKM
jgi:hypothetical protein